MKRLTPELEKLIDAVAWASTEFRIAIHQTDMAKLTGQLDALEKDILEIHRIVDTFTEPVSNNIKTEIRICELGLERLRAKAAGDPNWRGRKPK
jgi:hypothetical protein